MCGTLFRCTGLLVHTRRVCATPCPGISFFLHQAIGAPEPRRRFTLSGRQFFQLRLSGMLELPQVGSPLTDGKFSAEIQRGVRRLRTVGASRRPPRGQKGRTTCGFPSSLNSYLSLASQSDADCRHVTAAKQGERQRIFSSVFFATCSQCQIPYCYTCD